MRDAAGNVPAIARADFGGLVANGEIQATGEQQTELLVRVAVHLVYGAWQEQRTGELHVVAMNGLEDITAAEVPVLCVPREYSLHRDGNAVPVQLLRVFGHGEK